MLRQYPGNNRYYNTSFKFLLKQAPLAVSRYKVEICKRKEGRKRGGETKEIKVKKKRKAPHNSPTVPMATDPIRGSPPRGRK